MLPNSDRAPKGPDMTEQVELQLGVHMPQQHADYVKKRIMSMNTGRLGTHGVGR